MTLRNAFEDLATEATLEGVRDALGDVAHDTSLKDGTQRTRIHFGDVDVDGIHPLPVAGVFADANGVPYSQSNRLPVSVGDLTIQELNVNFPDSVVSGANSRSTGLAANEEWIGSFEDILQYSAIGVVIFTDQASALNGAKVQFSTDGVSVDRTVAASIPANTGLYFVIDPEAKYVRFRFQNGPTASTIFRAQVIYRYQTPAIPQLPLAAQTTDLNVAGMVQSHLKGRHSSGAWLPASVDTTGRLQVVVGNFPATQTDALTDAQLRANPVPVDTGLVIPSPQTDALTDAELRASPVPVDTGLTIPQPQTDALTDAELRAAPVPVDTGLTIPQPQTDALTDQQLRAAPVPVDTGLTIPQPQTDALTDAQLRASPVPVDTGLVLPTPQTDALTDEELRAAPVVVDTGLIIPQPQTDALTDEELRAAPVPVSVTNPTANPETGLAKDATVSRRFAPNAARRTASGLFSTTGTNVCIQPAAGKRVRLYWIGLSSSQDNPGENMVQFRFGPAGTPIYSWYMGNPGAFSHFEIVEGAINEALYITLTNGTNPVLVNATWEDV